MNDLIFGHTWEEIQAMQQGTYRRPVIRPREGDSGADPLGDGMFKMYPSGDIVNREEKQRRLGH